MQDESVDLRDNIIGQAVGNENQKVIGDDGQLAGALLEQFYESGPWVAELQPGGKYKAVMQKLTDAEFEVSPAKLDQLGGPGLKPARGNGAERGTRQPLGIQGDMRSGNLEYPVRQLSGAP